MNGQCPAEASVIIQAANVATCSSSDKHYSLCVEFNNMTEMHVSTAHTYHMHIVWS